MTAPALSILLPTWNGARYLREQVDTLLAQTFTDFEVLAIDDGSSDGTPAILADYAARDPRFRVIPSSGNRGQKARLADLAALSRSEWLAISDQDDIWAPDKLERLLAAVGDAALAFGRSDLIDGAGQPLGTDLLQALGAPRQPDDRLFTLFKPQISGHAMIARRELFAASLFDHPEPFDWLIGLLAEFSRGVVYDHDAVVHHRLHDTNSHNVTIMARLNPLLLRPRHLRMVLDRPKRARERLLAAFEMLGRSELVPEDRRAIFSDLDARSRVALGGRGTASQKRALRRRIIDTLAPMAGSPRDFRRFQAHLDLAIHGYLHPLGFPWLLRPGR